MRIYKDIDFKAMYNELAEAQIKFERTPTKEPNWWDFIKDARFWLEVIKIVFKFIFKV